MQLPNPETLLSDISAKILAQLAKPELAENSAKILALISLNNVSGFGNCIVFL